MTRPKRPPLAWDDAIRRILAYRDERGDADVPLRYIDQDGVHLGEWLALRRGYWRRGKLTDEQEAALRAAGVRPAMRRVVHSWDDWIDILRATAREAGTADLHRRHVAGDGSKIGFWLDRRRWEWRHGGLTDGQVGDLVNAGVTPPGSDSPAGLWSVSDVATKLGVSRQAVQAAIYRGTIPRPAVAASGGWGSHRYWTAATAAEVVSALEGMDRRRRRATYVGALRSWVAAHGHAQVPFAYVTEDGVRLGRWLSVQRARIRAGNLRADRVAELEALGVAATLDSALAVSCIRCGRTINRHNSPVVAARGAFCTARCAVEYAHEHVVSCEDLHPDRAALITDGLGKPLASAVPRNDESRPHLVG